MDEECELTSAMRRNDVSRDWLSSETLADRLGLLVVFSPERQHHEYPDWQFDAKGNPISEMREILALLRQMWNDGEGWHEVEWFLQHRASLDGAAPFQVLRSNPQVVLELAQADLADDGASNW